MMQEMRDEGAMNSECLIKAFYPNMSINLKAMS